MHGPDDATPRDDTHPGGIDVPVALPDEAIVPQPADERPSPFPLDEPNETYARERAREHDRAEDKKRGEYEAFIAHHSVTMWDRTEHVGTVMAADAVSIVVHVGRQNYVRIEIPHASHGSAAPSVGERVVIDRSGNVTRDAAPERDRSHVLERRGFA